ncbi:GNAT family N-acetyltransferase [Pseudosulfitobacter sp. SM2401]|uniref:GNAT family N-acetyltransferase n=1 Tax=Pseudosulfitobacter sp. SM2401 TaxID=3350098 RepID=UPI0036F33B32
MNNTPSSERRVGPVVTGWSQPDAPFPGILTGTSVQLERLEAEKHAALLFRAFEGHDHVWDYLPYGPFSSASQYYRWAREAQEMTDTVFYAIKNLDTGAFEGVASYLRIAPQSGSIEVGHINMSPALQNTRAATEAMYLMMAWAFEAGYRRYEWKCDALNKPSRRAAQRLGFSYEGVFRQATIVKNRNRDTAWFAAIDLEWPALKEAFAAWLNPSNFDSDGRQIERLSDLTRLVRPHDDPTQT